MEYGLKAIIYTKKVSEEFCYNILSYFALKWM